MEKRKRNKRIMAFLMAIVLIVTLIIPEGFGLASGVTNADSISLASPSDVDDGIMLMSSENALELKNYIDTISVSKNGQTVDSVNTNIDNTATEQLQVRIDYTVDKNIITKIVSGELDTFTYALPDTIIIPNNTSFTGPVIGNSATVGQYTVSADGQITINIDKDKITDEDRSMTGYLQFNVQFDLDKASDDGKIHNSFYTKDGTTDIPIEVNYKPDIDVEKEATSYNVDYSNNKIICEIGRAHV